MTASAASLEIEGYLESYDGRTVVGWAWLPGEPAARIVVEVLVDGVQTVAGVANLHRLDVEETGRGDGRYGFRLPLVLTSAGTVTARAANTGILLHGALRVGDAGALDPAAPTPWDGRVDAVRGLTITGWCWRPAEPDAHLTVEAVLDGRTVATATADRFRGDLVTGGIGSGDHSFDLDLPLWLADGVRRLLTVQVQGGGQLVGSPVEVAALQEGPLPLVDQLREAFPGPPPPEAEAALGLLGAYLRQSEALLPRSLPWSEYPAWRAAMFPRSAPASPAGEGLDRLAAGTAVLLPGEPEAVVAVLDAGAELLPGALARARAVFAETQADILYADAEVDTALGLLPWFRPAWSYDLFLAQDYTRGLLLLRPSLLARDARVTSLADLKMAAVEAAAPGRIHHLPEVLVRLRSGEADGSAWLGTVASHLRRRGVAGSVVPLDAGATRRRVHWPVPDPAPLVSLIIPTRDRCDLLVPCIESIRRLTTYAPYEIIVIDNQSREAETLAYLRAGAATGAFRVVHYDAPFNFSAMNNRAAAQARGQILGFINNDVELISPDWLQEAVGLLARPEVGAVGARLRFANGMIQHGGVVLGVGGLAENAFQHLHAGDEGYFGRTQVAGNYSAVTAACLFCRAETFAAFGGFDAANLPVAFNDVDFCLRLRERGDLVVWTPHIELYHHESVSRGRDASAERRARAYKEEAYMRQRWASVLLRDPYYSPNLNLDRRPYTGLALPPRQPWGAARRGERA
ncbi:MAG TPA: glycosyltransferase [Azospirillaceae bacterium]|nr:glycosyltransferase [Azospirillaceae bacterium]